MNQMGYGGSRRDPRDTYTLTVQPDAGPALNVPIDMVQVELAGDSSYSDPSGARMREINRQIAAHATANRIDLRGVNLTAYQERFKPSLRGMTRMARVEGIVYRVGGRIPDPRDAQVAAQIRALQQAREDLVRQTASAQVAAQRELEQQRALYEGQIEVMRKRQERQTQSYAPAPPPQNPAALRQAEQRARAAEDDLTLAMERIGALEMEARQLMMQRDTISDQVDDLAAKNVELKNLRDEIARMKRLIETPPSSPRAPADSSPPASSGQVYGIKPDEGL